MRGWRVAGAVIGAVVMGVGALTVVDAGAASSPVYGTYVPTNATIERVPYVTDLTTSSAEVNWAQNTATRGYLTWGPGTSCTANKTATAATTIPAFTPDLNHATAVTDHYTVSGAAEYQSSMLLSGLGAGKTYCYEPWSSTGVSLAAPQSFSTLDVTAPSTGVTFDVVGDLGETTGVDQVGNVNTDQAAIDTGIGQSGAKFTVLAGDVAYSGGTDTNYGDLTTTGSEVSNIFGPSYWPNTGGIPTYAASGNHGQIITGLRTWPEEQIAESDTANPGTYSYEQYPADSLIPTTNTPDSWYAVQDGNVRIYVLDAAWADGTTYLATTKATGALCASDPADCKGYQIDAAEHWAAGSAEMTWLKRDLAAQPAGTIKMAVFHYPLQSLNNTQQSDPYLQAALQPVLQQYGVSMAFNGHAHTYQRFVPNNGSLISYVTGGGGGTLQPVDGTNDTKGKCAAAVASEQVYALGLGSAGVIDCGQSAPPMTKNASGSYYVPNESAANVYNFLKVNVTGNVITVTPMNALDQPFDQQSYTVVNGVTTLSTGDGDPADHNHHDDELHDHHSATSAARSGARPESSVQWSHEPARVSRRPVTS